MKLTRIAILVALGACVSLFGCGEPPETEAQTGAATGGVVLSPASLPAGVFGFDVACLFPGTNVDPHFFGTASVGGKLTVTGATFPQNNGTFTITHYVPVGGDATNGANPGNVFTSAACMSETFPASAVVTYFAP